MKQSLWHRCLTAALAALLGGLLVGCGAGDGGGTQAGAAVPVATVSDATAADADAGSADMIDAAAARGEVDADTALSYKVFALFRDPRLPARFQGAAGTEADSNALEEASARFESMTPAVQQALAPFLQRPADVGSWASPVSSRPTGADLGGAMRAQAAAACKGQSTRWAAVAAGQVKVWYQPAVAGDQATAVATAAAIDGKVWPALVGSPGARPAPDDTSPAGCDGGDGGLDVYLVHGIQARALTVPAAGSDPSSVFALANADVAAEATANAAQAVTNALFYARQAAASDTGAGGRQRALARVGNATAAAVAGLPVPAVLQMKSASLSTPVSTVTLDGPVTAGNWLAVAVSTLGATPANVSLSDNQAHFNLNFASAGLKYGSTFGSVWRYIKLTGTGSYTLTIDRAAATSGNVQIVELGNVSATTFLDVAAVGTSGNSTTPAATFRTTRTTNDLLLSVVAVRSGAATITPTSPAGTVLAGSTSNGLATSGLMAFNTSSLAIFRSAATLGAAAPWRMSALAIRGAAAPPVVVAPVNTALPVITVTDHISHLGLTSSQGSWANTPTSYAYSWTRNGTVIPGATLASYSTTVADEGTSVAAVVTASNSAGSASATSVAVPVPVPGPPTVPSLAFTATPTSVVQGQPSTLAWTSTAAASCTASGAWSGAQPVNGSLAVTPAAPSTYELACTGPGGTVTASVTVDVTAPPPGSTPTTGAHSLVFHISKGSVGATMPTAPMTTQSGSTMLAFVGKGSIWNLSPPFDNKGNTPYVQIGAIHEYTNWPGEGTTVYAFNSIVGGANHILSVDDSNVWDEVTFAAVEVRNGGLIQDYKWNEVLRSLTQTSQSVTTTGPATLVAVWYGDDSSSTPSNPVPNNGFTVIEGNGNATESVQMFVATKDVPAAGTYNVTWTTTPLQGAQLYLIAVQKR